MMIDHIAGIERMPISPQTPLGAADWICLAAAPTFAIMALLTGLSNSPDMLCSAMRSAAPLGGMAPMYLLMSGFHLAPWLKLISSRRAKKRSAFRRHS
jgi:hypothetical protein